MHTVAQGECMARIAKKYGFPDWTTIYNHPQNASLREQRPDPNILYPGDQVFVPEISVKQISRATDQRHKFVLKTPKRTLRIALAEVKIATEGNAAETREAHEAERKALASVPYVLLIDGTKQYKGSTDGQGRLSVDIPIDAQTGRLTVNDHFWDLQIACLNPVQGEVADDGVSGAQGRLKNLGYYEGAINGIMDSATKEALQRFQSDELLDATGTLNDETRAKLAKIHAC